ncbi:MAG: hypothetical protein P8N76_15645 [Pirellulaceae bacterium]|nr:hypothetical protein [Pirellulaceae bacterium]
METLRLTDATATQWNILTQIRRLRSIDLSNSSVTGELLKVVGQIPSLMSLKLDGTKVTTSGLQHLVGSKKLRFLSLKNTSITNRDLQAIGQISNLETLMRDSNAITDTDLEHLLGLKELKDVTLRDTQINVHAKNLQALSKMCHVEGP